MRLDARYYTYTEQQRLELTDFCKAHEIKTINHLTEYLLDSILNGHYVIKHGKELLRPDKKGIGNSGEGGKE